MEAFSHSTRIEMVMTSDPIHSGGNVRSRVIMWEENKSTVQRPEYDISLFILPLPSLAPINERQVGTSKPSSHPCETAIAAKINTCPCLICAFLIDIEILAQSTCNDP